LDRQLNSAENHFETQNVGLRKKKNDEKRIRKLTLQMTGKRERLNGKGKGEKKTREDAKSFDNWLELNYNQIIIESKVLQSNCQCRLKKTERQTEKKANKWKLKSLKITKSNIKVVLSRNLTKFDLLQQKVINTIQMIYVCV